MASVTMMTRRLTVSSRVGGPDAAARTLAFAASVAQSKALSVRSLLQAYALGTLTAQHPRASAQERSLRCARAQARLAMRAVRFCARGTCSLKGSTSRASVR